MKNIITTTILLFFALCIYSQQSPLTLDINHNLDESSGGIFDVEIRVSDFVDLYSAQLFLKWNPEHFRIDGVPYVNDELPFFDDTSVILPVEDLSIPDKGKVRIIWSNATTLTLPDDTHIVTLRFTALGAPCDQSKFFFEDIGTDESEKLLAADASFQNIGVEFENMNVQIPGVGCTSSDRSLEESISVSIYPNPVLNVLTVDMQNNDLQNASLSILSLQGKSLKEVKLGQAMNNIDLNEFSNGSYLYSIKSASQIVKRGSLLKIN